MLCSICLQFKSWSRVGGICHGQESRSAFGTVPRWRISEVECLLRMYCPRSSLHVFLWPHICFCANMGSNSESFHGTASCWLRPLCDLNTGSTTNPQRWCSLIVSAAQPCWNDDSIASLPLAPYAPTWQMSNRQQIMTTRDSCFGLVPTLATQRNFLTLVKRVCGGGSKKDHEELYRSLLLPVDETDKAAGTSLGPKA